MDRLYDVVSKCQANTKCIRNICILAHVDHGKTTLVDSLCASNGIISNNIAGELRYMDSRDDEQERGITMKSSAISLLYNHIISHSLYLINLVDTPGHIDLSFEVSAGIRVCDGAIILIDVVEGVCSQTYSVIRLAFTEGLKIVIFLNKMDKLYTHLNLTVQQSFIHLKQIVEQVNSIIAQYFISEEFQQDQSTSKDAADYVSPEAGNVIFGSSTDGWAFTIPQFAEMFSKKIKDQTASDVAAHMWGNYFWCSKTSKFEECTESHKLTIFESFVLSNIWTVYEAAHKKYCRLGQFQRDSERFSRIARRVVMSDKVNFVGTFDVSLLMSNWLPLYKSVFDVVVEFLPSPLDLDCGRVRRLLGGREVCGDVMDELTNITPNGSTLVAFMSKLVFVPLNELPRKYQILFDQKESNFVEFCIGFTRSFCGTIRKGDSLFLLGPKHDSRLIEDSSTLPVSYKHGKKITIENLFIFMGRELICVDMVSPGNIFGFSWSECCRFMKTATLSERADLPPLTPLHLETTPILAVSVEPENIDDMSALKEGLELLYLSDPCVETHVTTLGEQVIRVAGQLHLDKCIEDLRTRFARVPLSISRPIVQLREGLVCGDLSVCVHSNSLKCEIGVEQLPIEVVRVLTDHSTTAVDLLRKECAMIDSDMQICAVCSTNVIINGVDGGNQSTVSSIMNGVKLAMEAGPLCEEPLHGICCTIRQLEGQSDDSGQVSCDVRNAIWSVLVSSLRLLQPVLLGSIRVPAGLIGKVKGVIARRGGRVVTEDYDLTVFMCHSYIPMLNSFGIDQEMRSRTRGMCTCHFKFSHWEVVGDAHDNLLTQVRLRKGLLTHEQIVRDPNKQRTLARKK